MSKIHKILRAIAKHTDDSQTKRFISKLKKPHRDELIKHIAYINDATNRKKSGGGKSAKVVYHGTPDHEKIKKVGFKVGVAGKRSGFLGAERSVTNHSIYTSENPAIAHAFGSNRANHPGDARVFKIYMHKKNMLDLHKSKKVSVGGAVEKMDDPTFVAKLRAKKVGVVKMKETPAVRKWATGSRKVSGNHTYAVLNPKHLALADQVHIDTHAKLRDHARKFTKK